jgi:hypothetical protein
MKISPENYQLIKVAISKFLDERSISIDLLKDGDLFSLHQLFALLAKEPLNPNKRNLSETWFVDGAFIYPKYEAYPNNCNDTHISTVFNKLRSEPEFKYKVKQY